MSIDPNDRVILDHANMSLRVHFALMLGQDVSMSDLVRSLTDPEVRHHVQTILDLEPTRRR